MVHLEEQQTQLLILWSVIYKAKVILGMWMSSDFKKRTEMLCWGRGGCGWVLRNLSHPAACQWQHFAGSMTEWLSVFSDNCASSQHSIQTLCSCASSGIIKIMILGTGFYMFMKKCVGLYNSLEQQGSSNAIFFEYLSMLEECRKFWSWVLTP